MLHVSLLFREYRPRKGTETVLALKRPVCTIVTFREYRPRKGTETHRHFFQIAVSNLENIDPKRGRKLMLETVESTEEAKI